MTHPQQQLIDKWRARATEHNAPGTGVYGYQMRGASRAYSECANELEAALSAGAVPQTDKWADFLAEWVDFNRGKGTSAEAWEAFMEQEHQHSPVTGCKCRICESAGAVPQPHEGLADWLDMLRAGMERHQDTADLFMQEITGLENWARILRAGAVPQQEPQEPLGEVWRMIEMGWDIESRAYFEEHALKMGFKHPLSQAIHHMHKRCVKENPDWLREPAVPSLPAPQEQDAITVNDFVCAVGEMTNADALQRVKELVRSSDKRGRARIIRKNAKCSPSGDA